ncbi:hypothetical protein WR25_09063 [Diploscapter pachys]|uniref:Uncharacterized protein n=1 Tax=Diploscapter pachys TaxID=2018661 RepID=A0A2A2LAG8_9BILA|nr:hypothetical protein WR25_09063 [Diploscapter pachys]
MTNGNAECIAVPSRDVKCPEMVIKTNCGDDSSKLLDCMNDWMTENEEMKMRVESRKQRKHGLDQVMCFQITTGKGKDMQTGHKNEHEMEGGVRVKDRLRFVKLEGNQRALAKAGINQIRKWTVDRKLFQK